MSVDVLALTVHQPWAWSIVAGHKPVENRTWSPDRSLLGQFFMIHASQEIESRAIDLVRELTGAEEIGWLNPVAGTRLATGAIIGCARFVGVASHSDRILPELVSKRRDEILASRWFTGPIGWVFEDAVQFASPIPCRGQQYLWTVEQSVAAKCREAFKKAKAA